jgi:hypothetical protein
MHSLPEIPDASKTFADLLQEETCILQAKHPILADAIGRGHAILQDGLLHPEDDGHTATVWSSDGQTTYSVNGTCTCPAQLHHQAACKHRLAFRLYQRIVERLTTPPAAARVPPQYIQMIHGHPFVRYAGLLAMAHERGLRSLKARFVSVTGEVALAEAEATFADGRVFSECADSSPENVHASIRPHFARLSLTRAKARALRDALSLDMCSVEEMGDESHPGAHL